MSASDRDDADLGPVALAVFLFSACAVLYELLLTRLFAVVLFASFAHLALALALLGTGIGAMAQHLRPSLVPAGGARRSLGWIGLGLAASSLAAVLAVLHFPVLRAVDGPLTTFQATSTRKGELLDQGWFLALLPILSVPFAFAGLAFAGAFQRYASRIGRVYAADLAGGAAGAMLFVPALQALAGPDVAFLVVGLGAAGSAVCLWGERGPGRLLAGAAGLLSAAAVAFGLRGDVLGIRRTAGFSEAHVTYTEWTPLVRLAVHEAGEKALVLLDNTSASQVPRTEQEARSLEAEANRALVYRLADPPGRVAVLAAAGGPEVVVARRRGFEDVAAVDLESAIFRVVEERFPDAPANPYRDGSVRRVHLDGRAAILGDPGRYEVIQMVHANLWSAAGILANTWSPALLETTEAFGTYLDHLEPDGLLSFGRGPETATLARAASAALAERGVERPWQAVAWVKGRSQVALIRPRPWTEEEARRLQAEVAGFDRAELAWPVEAEEPPAAWRRLMEAPPMTDDRPYVDTWADVRDALADAGRRVAGEDRRPLADLYLSVFVQLGFVAAAGLIFVALPWALRGRSETREVAGTAALLGYVACLGYGYLAVETVLVHQLVLFVGHPTYAITVVILAMLLGSGLGSAWLGTASEEEAPARLRRVLGGVLLLGIGCGVAAPPMMTALALSWPLPARAALTFAVLFPLGVLMGAPFPLALRAVGSRAAPAIPWAWAINGWMSVLASLTTVVVARLAGYSAAYALALGAYGLAWALAGRLPPRGPGVERPPAA